MVLSSPQNSKIKMNERYPHSVIERKVLGKDVTILGVYHTPKQFVEHRDFFEEQVSRHDAIVVEGGYGEALFDFGGFEFFESFAELARLAEKPVYCADSLTRIGVEIHEKQWSLSLRAGGVSALVAIAGDLADSSLIQGMSGLGAASSLSLMLGSELYGVIYNNKSVMNTLRPFIFGLIDYRDIKIADGVRQICSERDHDRLLVVHGDGHSFGIDFYLKNLNLGRAKLLFYHKYEEYAKRRGVSVVREYSPVSNSDAALALERDAESCPDIYLFCTPENYAWKKGELPQKS